MDSQDFKQLYEPLLNQKMSDEFRARVIDALQHSTALDQRNHRPVGFANRLSAKLIAVIVALVLVICPAVVYAIVQFIVPTIIGKPIVQHLQESVPTQADLQKAVHVVMQLEEATNAGKWNVVQSMVYNTAPTQMPKNWFEIQAKRYPPGTPHAVIPQAFMVGTPYVIENWTTKSTNAQLNPSSSVSHAYSKEFQYAITVPVYFGHDKGHPVLLHCVRDAADQWLVAYNWLTGYDVDEHSGN